MTATDNMYDFSEAEGGEVIVKSERKRHMKDMIAKISALGGICEAPGDYGSIKGQGRKTRLVFDRADTFSVRDGLLFEDRFCLEKGTSSADSFPVDLPPKDMSPADLPPGIGWLIDLEGILQKRASVEDALKEGPITIWVWQFVTEAITWLFLMRKDCKSNDTLGDLRGFAISDEYIDLESDFPEGWDVELYDARGEYIGKGVYTMYRNTMKSHILYCSSGIVACPPHQAPVESYSARGLDASSGDESHDTLPVRGKLRGGVVGEYIVYADDYYKFSGEERWRDIMQLVEARGEYVKPRSKIQSRFNSGRASDFFKVAVTAEAHSPKGRGLYRLLLS